MILLQITFHLMDTNATKILDRHHGMNMWINVSLNPVLKNESSSPRSKTLHFRSTIIDTHAPKYVSFPSKFLKRLKTLTTR